MQIILNPNSWPEAYRKIVTKLKEKGVNEIGVLTYRDQNRFKNKEGEVRAASLDLGREGRIERTSMIRHLSMSDLLAWHKLEIDLGHFCYGPSVKKITNQDWKPTILSSERMDAIEAFNQANRPTPIQYYGISIPPYFPYDNEFDGMDYHHAWDKNILANINDLVLPEFTVRRSTRSILSENE